MDACPLSFTCSRLRAILIRVVSPVLIMSVVLALVLISVISYFLVYSRLPHMSLFSPMLMTSLSFSHPCQTSLFHCLPFLSCLPANYFL
jgi:hypothetical protein